MAGLARSPFVHTEHISSTIMRIDFRSHPVSIRRLVHAQTLTFELKKAVDCREYTSAMSSLADTLRRQVLLSGERPGKVQTSH